MNPVDKITNLHYEYNLQLHELREEVETLKHSHRLFNDFLTNLLDCDRVKTKNKQLAQENKILKQKLHVLNNPHIDYGADLKKN